jgi:hypothetical protein
VEILRGAIEYIETLEDLLHGSNGNGEGGGVGLGDSGRDFLRDPSNVILHSNSGNSIIMVSYILFLQLFVLISFLMLFICKEIS